MTLEFLISLLLTGLVVGALARLALPGPNPIGILMTIVCGIAGAFIGGIIATAIGVGGWAAFAIAVLCATGLVYLVSGGARRRRPLVGGRRGLF
ncbi:MAG TPA: hypothetical protein VM345_09135 [Acidimicrobiales bacterium]|jgi:uncharacterized membrane protein YeaQ/YmgE (transglycosylase-associated protein family)|nr:hypothetical protein [Acidimicrobiales bacterium]